MVLSSLYWFEFGLVVFYGISFVGYSKSNLIYTYIYTCVCVLIFISNLKFCWSEKNRLYNSQTPTELPGLKPNKVPNTLDRANIIKITPT